MTDMVLQTKLQPPQLKGKILRRQRLINLLQENLDKKLILVCADAGYGKTTLLAQFCAELDRTYLFYDLDTSDNDIATFFNYLVAGIQQCYSGFGQRTKSVIPQTRNIEIIVGTFINEFVEYSFHRETYEKMSLRGSETTEAISPVYKKHRIATPAYQQAHNGKDFYIILDDYHHLQQNKEIGNALDYLLRHLPSNLHLIISSRSSPPLNLAYYLAKQDLFKLEKEQLQFDIKEIQALLKEVYNLKIPDSEIERIKQHSEGWITAIQLILQKISTIGEDKAKETLNGYIASGEEIFNYFAKEVFDTQPKEIQEFLMKTSILEEITHEICREVFEIGNAQEILKYLQEEHLFVSRIDTHFRYHPLFRKFLVEYLKKEHNSSEINYLLKKTAAYFERNNDLPDAVNYYLQSKTFRKAARVIAKLSSELISKGQVVQLIQWTDQIPSEILQKYPLVLIKKVEAYLFLGEWDKALNILKGKLKLKSPSIRSKAYHAMGIILFRRGDYRAALGVLKKAQRLLGKKELHLRAKIHHTLGWIKLHLGSYLEAGVYFQKGLSLAQRVKGIALTAEIINSQAVLELKKGNLNKALEYYESLLGQFGNEYSLNIINIYGNAASVYLEAGSSEKVIDLINKAEMLAGKFNDQRSLIYLKGIRGNYHLKLKEYDTAIRCFEEALSMNQNLGEMAINLFAYNDLAKVYKEKRDYKRCAEYIDKVEKIIKDKRGSFYMDHLFLKADFSLVKKDYSEAKRYIKEMFHIARTIKSYRDIIRGYIFLAKIAAERRHNREVSLNLKKVLKLAHLEELFPRECLNNLDFFKFLLNNGIAREYCIKILSKSNFPEARALLESSTIQKGKKYIVGIDLFGSIRVRDGNGRVIDVHWPSKKINSLMAYMVDNRKSLCERDLLVDNFWSEAGIKEGRHNLQTGITFIRNLIYEVIGHELKKKDIIIYRSGCYYWNSNIIFKVDVEEFENLIKTAGVLEKKNAQKGYNIYRKTLEIYKGDFCADLYDPWCEEKKRYYRELCLKVLKKMAEFQFSKRRYDESLSLYRQALTFDKFDETIYQGIMKNLAAMGNLVGVKEVYNNLKAILKSELDTEPTAETIRIFKDLITTP